MRALTEADWEAELRGELGYPVRVRYGRSRSSPIAMRPPTARELARAPELRSGYVVRLHPLFASTPPEVRRAIASWMRSGRRARAACRVMGEWMDAALAALPPEPVDRGTLVASGTCHDLERLARPLLASEFRTDFGPHRPAPDLSWGRRARSRTKNSLRLGSFEPTQGLVRIHPVLDQLAVPEWFLRCVLFHELLHAAVPPEQSASGRTLHHGPEFRRRERLYVDYARSLAWESEHIGALLRSARSGKPMRANAAEAKRAGASGRLLSICRQLELF